MPSPRQRNRIRKAQDYAAPFASGVFLAENPNRRPNVARLQDPRSGRCTDRKRTDPYKPVTIMIPARANRQDGRDPRIPGKYHEYTVKRIPGC